MFAAPDRDFGQVTSSPQATDSFDHSLSTQQQGHKQPDCHLRYRQKTMVAAPSQPVAGPSTSSLIIRVCSDVVSELLVAHDEGRDVNLNGLISRTAKLHGCKRIPRLTDVIAACPPEAKDILLPKLRAKPVRTASGIAVVAVMSKPHRCPHTSTTGQHRLRLNRQRSHIGFD